MAVAALAGSCRGPAGVGIPLPTTLSADESSGGLGVKMSFERIIVAWPSRDRGRDAEGAAGA
jgi:hypothetical protein